MASVRGGAEKLAQAAGVETRDVAAEKRISEEARLMLTIAAIEKIVWLLPLNIAFGALASMVGKAIVASHTDDEMRRNNRAVFINTLDNVIKMEEEKVEFEARIRRDIDKQVEEMQRKDPLKPVNSKAIELEIRAKARKASLKEAH